jgi:hypothetical protein
MTGYECFALYQALKLHFTSNSYDFFKYEGKTRVTVSSFEKRNDKYHFYKLSRKYHNREVLLDFMVANFLDNEKLWIGDLLLDDAEMVYMKRQKFLQSLSYAFENDCRIIFDGTCTPNDNLTTDGGYPILLVNALRKEINIETLCILNMILNFLPMWKRKINDDIIWPEFCKKVEKYTPFIPKDIEKYKKILRKIL